MTDNDVSTRKGHQGQRHVCAGGHACSVDGTPDAKPVKRTLGIAEHQLCSKVDGHGNFAAAVQG
jgi:hypothetical protein